MNITIEQLMLIVALLLLSGVLASKVSDRFGVPALLLFLVIGMLAGSDGPGGIYFDNYWLSQTVGIIALVFILFSGGLDTRWQNVRPVLWPGLSLATVGTLLTALLTATFAYLVFGIRWTEGLLLGAIVSSTDAAAVMAVFNSGSTNVKARLGSLIEWESGTNDPMAVFLTLGALELITNPSTTLPALLLRFVLQMALGALLGYVAGHLSAALINRMRLGSGGLYPVLTVALTLLTYGGASVLGGSGFLAVYVAGVVLGNRPFVHRRSLLSFHNGLAWLMQVVMFLILGLLVFPHQLLPVAGAGLLFTAFLMFVARPLSVAAGLAFGDFTWRDKLFVSWAGLRGAVPIILATYPFLVGIERAGWLFDLVFFVVLVSVLLQGTTIKLFARWLGLQAETPTATGLPVPPGQAALLNELRELAIPARAALDGHMLVDLAMPDGFMVVAVRRGSEHFIPSGQTVLRSGDRLLVLADDEQFQQVAGRVNEGNKASRPRSQGG